jgi:hypothetical protein
MHHLYFGVKRNKGSLLARAKNGSISLERLRTNTSNTALPIVSPFTFNNCKIDLDRNGDMISNDEIIYFDYQEVTNASISKELFAQIFLYCTKFVTDNSSTVIIVSPTMVEMGLLVTLVGRQIKFVVYTNTSSEDKDGVIYKSISEIEKHNHIPNSHLIVTSTKTRDAFNYIKHVNPIACMMRISLKSPPVEYPKGIFIHPPYQSKSNNVVTLITTEPNNYMDFDTEALKNCITRHHHAYKLYHYPKLGLNINLFSDISDADKENIDVSYLTNTYSNLFLYYGCYLYVKLGMQEGHAKFHSRIYKLYKKCIEESCF